MPDHFDEGLGPIAALATRPPSRPRSIVGVNASIHSGAIDTDAALDSMASRIDQKLGWLRDGAGDRSDDLELNAWLAFAEVTDDVDGAAALLGELFGVDPAEAGESPPVLFGPAGLIAERLGERRERWGTRTT